MNEQQKAAAFDRLVGQVHDRINREVHDWQMGYNPPESYQDISDKMCEKLLNQADDMGLYDFFELIVLLAFNYPISANNPYAPKVTQILPENHIDEIRQSFVDLPDKLRKAGVL